MVLSKPKVAALVLLMGLFVTGSGRAAPPAEEIAKAVRLDDYGDPLPNGAIRRLGTLRFRHGGGINNLRLTPDGKTLISNDYYGTRMVCVWDLASGKLLRQFPGTYEQSEIALSSDGKSVAIGQKEAIILWDLASGKEVRRLAQPGANGAAFSPDGKTLAAVGNYADIYLWDVAAGKKIARFQDPGINALLAFTPDGRTLVAGQRFNSPIGLWDVASGKKRKELDAKAGAIFSFALSPDGATLAMAAQTALKRLER